MTFDLVEMSKYGLNCTAWADIQGRFWHSGSGLAGTEDARLFLGVVKGCAAF